MLDHVPESAQALHPVLGRVACNDGRVNGADRSADHPVGLDTRFLHGLNHAGLKGAERTATLQYEYHLPGEGVAGDRPIDATTVATTRPKANTAVHIHDRTHWDAPTAWSTCPVRISWTKPTTPNCAGSQVEDVLTACLTSA